MRLLYIANIRIPTEKAHGLQIVKTIEALESIGAYVKLLVPSRKNHIKTNIADFYNISGINHLVKVFDIARPLQYISERIYFPFQRLWFGIVAFVYALFWRGTIYSRDITVSFLLSLFGKQVMYEDHEPKNRFRWIYGFFLRHIPKKVIVAQNLVEQYQEMNMKKASYVLAPNGVDVKEFDEVNPDKSLWNRKFRITENNPVTLYVGHFYKWKGVYTLLDAAKDIRGEVVLIGGTKEDYESVEQYIKERSISNVHLHKFMPHKEVIKYIKSADILVLPNTATEVRSQKYTTPIKLFEYMASGVPIIASNVLSFTPYLRNKKNALLCEPDNPSDLARAVNQALQDRYSFGKLAQSARESVNQYTWDSRVRKIVDFME